MVWNSIIQNLRYNATLRNNNALDSRKLEAYLRESLGKNDSQLPFQNTEGLRVSNIKRIGGGLINNIYSFVLTYFDRNEKKQLYLTLKFYRENVDPVRCARARYILNQDLRMCIREWQALRSLERVGLAVPKAYHYECDSKFLGYPFLIMGKIDRLTKTTDEYVDSFAISLAYLHNIEVESLGLTAIKAPTCGYTYAKRWPLHFKHFLNIETKHDIRSIKNFDFAINWLEKNVSNNYCPKYSLIHGDSHPANAFLTKNSQITLVDWDSVDIGDPAFDVGSAYHTIKFFSNPKDPDSAEQLAERFLSEYLKKSNGDIRLRLKFYQVVGILGYSISYSSCLSSPIMAYKYQQRKVMNSIPFLKLPLILLAFPFFNWSFVAQQMQIEGAIDWLKYFENFLKKL